MGLGVDAEETVALETACLVLGYSRLLMGWNLLFTDRLWGLSHRGSWGVGTPLARSLLAVLSTASFNIHSSLVRYVG